MEQPDFQRSFLKLAANLPENDRVPFAFEKRIMARLSSGPALDPLTVWGGLLWKSVLPCLGVLLLTSMLAALTTQTDPYAPDLESAVLEPIAAEYDNW
jgi:hypothetical protein